FFQAEDGIRDFHVTGVQTCALPISLQAAAGYVVGIYRGRHPYGTFAEVRALAYAVVLVGALTSVLVFALGTQWNVPRSVALIAKIGRASCRERVESTAVAESSEKKV